MAEKTAYDLCSTAWSDKTGYVSFAVRDPRVGKHEPGYWKDVLFEWPKDHAKIKQFLDKAQRSRKDVYWAPAMFAEPRRSKAKMLPTDLLWADLDEVDPTGLPPHLAPTASWSTSPGRYQALWRMTKELEPDLQSKLNKSLSYAVGADKGGWDKTQVLRLPGTHNWKYDNVVVSPAHINGAKPLDPLKLSTSLVEVPKIDEKPITDLPDPKDVMRKYRRRISARAKQLLKARPGNAVEGQRSERLWELECLLAESGLSAGEIVSLTKGCVWNKFKGRHDELSRLSTEARKAISHTANSNPPRQQRLDDEDVAADGEEASDDFEDAFPHPASLSEFDKQRKPIRWLVADIWGEAEVGFISGPPKSYKSWLALDLAFSVATGTRYLSTFATRKANVLLIQEEDPKVVIQDRMSRIAGAKGYIGAEVTGPQEVEMVYDLPDNLYVLAGAGLQVTDEDWMEEVKVWVQELDIDLLIFDPLMMMAEGMDEFKAFDFMTKVLKPIKRLRADTGTAVVVVHHHTKSDKTGAGAMYGSVALWAWEEAALHLQPAQPGKITAERFSKHANLSVVNVSVGDIEQDGWKPEVAMGAAAAIDVGSTDDIIELLKSFQGGASKEELASASGLGVDAVQRRLNKLYEAGAVKRKGAPKEKGQRGRRQQLYYLEGGDGGEDN